MGEAGAAARDVLISQGFIRFVSTFARAAVAVIREGSEPLVVSTFAMGPGGADLARLGGVGPGTGRLVRLDATMPRCLQTAPAPAGDWHAYTPADSQPAAARREQLFLALDPGEDLAMTEHYLRRVWPLLREDCLREAEAAQPPENPLWQILDTIDVAVLILDARGLMYRRNAAADRALAEGTVLRRGRGGIFAAEDADSRRLRDTVARVATSSASETMAETVAETVFVTDAATFRRVPVTLRRYFDDGRATPYVTVMLPVCPPPERIEALGRQMGLTPVEARVASLIQNGLANREAAAFLGVTEQTFNTYAKRVLGKLNVSGRTEMAQLLTWQAAGGPVT